MIAEGIAARPDVVAGIMMWADRIDETAAHLVLLSFWQIVGAMTVMLGMIEMEGRRQDQFDARILRHIRDHVVRPGSLDAVPIPEGMKPTTIPIRIMELRQKGMLTLELLEDRPGYDPEFELAVTTAGEDFLAAVEARGAGRVSWKE